MYIYVRACTNFIFLAHEQHESKFQEKIKKLITCGCHKNKPRMLMH